MAEESGLSDRYRTSSPWPVFVAFGLAISEVGVLLGLFPVAVGGLLLFAGSVAGILSEAGYVDEPWPTLAGLGVALVCLGAAVYVYTGAPLTVEMVVEVLVAGRTVAYRGLAVVVSGAFVLLAAVVGWTVAFSTVESA